MLKLEMSIILHLARSSTAGPFLFCARFSKSGKDSKMLLGKVGNKSIAFINHKPFHPGNLQNLEKVWQAEEREAQMKKRQTELLEQRNHEVQIEELRKALREKERQQSALGLTRKTPSSRPEEHVKEIPFLGGLQMNRKRKNNTPKEVRSKRQKSDEKGKDGFRVHSIYEEDAFCNGHKAVWGSFYSRDDAKWGYACCRSLVQSDRCSNAPPLSG